MADHKPEPFYENADHCPHPMPERDAEPAAWDAWDELHETYDDGWLCRDRPLGLGCPACTEEHDVMMAWVDCRARDRAVPQSGLVPNPDAEHQPIAVWVGRVDCLERECDQYFDEDGEPDPGVERCAHIREETACSCKRQAGGEYGGAPCPALAAA